MTSQPAYSYPNTAEGYQYPAQQAYPQPQQQAYVPSQTAPVAYSQPQYPIQGQPQQQYGYAPQPYYSDPNEVRTVFITGFPPDMRERELENLLRFLPGYEACQLHKKASDFYQAFALFNTGALAYQASHKLVDLEFDKVTGVFLKCEMARKNMYIKGGDDSSKRARTDNYSHQYGGGGGGYHAQQPAQQSAPQGPRTYISVSNTKDNPPCSTLFIGNLGDQVSESELLSVFGVLPRFVTLKVVRSARNATAFVEYADLAAAMHVHDSQQGAVLQSSDRGGIRIQYSKNPFGKKRDHDGNPVDPATLPPIAGARASSATPEAQPLPKVEESTA